MIEQETDAGAAEIERVPTLVPGVDTILRGGFLSGGLYMIQGPPGIGKTILANQIIYNLGVQVRFAGGSVEGSHLFVATGRQPNTDDLGLETVGVGRVGDGTVRVDHRLRTTAAGIWAAGDIRGGPAFTHTAYDDFRVLRSQFLGDGSHDTRRIVPYAMFTDPELGRVGLSEAEARRAGKRVKIGRHAMADSGKARELGKTDGFIKVVIDAETDRILGATALCEQGAELVQLFVELIAAGATTRTVRDAIHIHPTLAEAAKNAVLAA